MGITITQQLCDSTVYSVVRLGSETKMIGAGALSWCMYTSKAAVAGRQAGACPARCTVLPQRCLLLPPSRATFTPGLYLTGIYWCFSSWGRQNGLGRERGSEILKNGVSSVGKFSQNRGEVRGKRSGPICGGFFLCFSVGGFCFFLPWQLKCF